MKSWAGLANVLIVFALGVTAGVLLTVVLVVISQDPGKAWSQLWEGVALPAWLLVVSLIFLLAGNGLRGQKRRK